MLRCPCPLFANYILCDLVINGEDFGLYLAVEAQAENPETLISTGDLDVTDTGSERVQKGYGNIRSPTSNQGGGALLIGFLFVGLYFRRRK